MHLQEWLTDEHLTKEGKAVRRKYASFISYFDDLGLKPYQRAHALHLLQNVNYNLLPDGYATPPHTINFCVNNVCNFYCSYCDLNHARKNKHLNNEKTRHNIIDTNKKYEFPFDIAKRIISEVAWFKPTIRIPWMESLLYKNLFPFIEYTKSHNLNFSMLTNGFLIKKYAEAIADHDVDALRISLDGPKHIHDKLCGINGAFEVIMQGLQRLVQLRKQGRCNTILGCYFTLNDINCDQMLPMLEQLDEYNLLEEMSVSFYMFNFISKDMAKRHNAYHAGICGASAEETSASHINLAKIDINKVLKQKDLISQKYAGRNVKIHYRPEFTKENMNLCLKDDRNMPEGSRCDTPWHTAFINPNGMVKFLPQCILAPFGNVLERPFLDVWNGAIMREQRQLLQEHKTFYGCSRCWSTYYSIEDTQSTWKDDASVIKK